MDLLTQDPAALPAAMGLLVARAGVSTIGPAIAALALVLLLLHEKLLAATARPAP